MFWLIYVKING